MKHKTHHLYYLFCTRGLASFLLWRCRWIFIALLLCNTITTAQETPLPGDFPVGTSIAHNLQEYPDVINAFDTTGFNTIAQHADGYTKGLLQKYNLMAVNIRLKTEYIAHYTTAYYSKWEAEQNLTGEDTSRVGFKHKGGQPAYWNDGNDTVLCWSTKDLSAPACSLMYGPHYRQDNRYKRWLYDGANYQNVQYVPRFRMALDYNDTLVSQNEDVCVLKVVFRYKIVYSSAPGDYEYIDSVFIIRTLKVSDFDSTGEFDDFYLNENSLFAWYKYPEQFILPKELENMANPPEYSYITYSESYTGIQFWVDWLRTDNLCTLYIDYAEVYDNDGWDEFIDNPNSVAYKVKTYAENFPESEWPNLIYWAGVDEPYSIDCYTPIHIVDSLIRSDPVNAPPLVVHFDPSWWHDFKINGEDEIAMFDSIAKPSKILLGLYPCSPDWPVIRPYDFEWLRFNFQRTSSRDSSFWFKPQTFGFSIGENSWCGWRKPKSPELTSMVMLSLAHGAKGILFEWFDSYKLTGYSSCAPAYIECLVDSNGTPEDNGGDTLYYTVKDNLVPRLKGKLGKTLMDLDYTGDYRQLRRYLNDPQLPDTPPTVNNRYLTLNEYPVEPTPSTVHFHAGFFESRNQLGNNHFLLANLITTGYRWVNIDVTDDGSNYINTRFRTIEDVNIFDTTFTDEFSFDMLFPPGEGYLFQVAPVVLYGGRLLHDEDVGGGMVLNDDMIIENGAALTIYGNYMAEANIIVKNGYIVNGENGKINFKYGYKLIIEGVASINGTSEDKLTFEFNGEDSQYGVVVDAAASLTISNCIIKNAETGITALVNAGTINIQNVDFNDCITSSITFLGQTGGPETERQIKYCTITNSMYGITASNLPELIIQENEITNTDLGIQLSNISRAIVLGNYIVSSTASLQGIFAESIGGEIRTNIISGHTNGIHLGNSSPDVGGNDITNCKFHGMYVGSGSEPNMVARLISNPNNHLWYPLSGYNAIYENGGYDGSGNDDDGSDIYISENANVIMSEGCNEIIDDREPSGNLVNTLLLMNGDNVFPQIQVEAQYNYWGETEVTSERFGDLDVTFDEYLSGPCPLPDEGGEDMLITRTSTGEVIDTLYPSGDVTIPLSEIEILYSNAEGSFITGAYTSAENYYDQIILIDTSLSVKKEAYTRKHEIGKLLGRGAEYFNGQRNTYLALAQTTSNTLLEKVFTQLSSLSLIGEEEYVPAIGEFDGIIQQNPNTEEAVYAEIDALTTALLVEGGDSTLRKGTLNKYLIKPGEDYLSKLDGLLRKHFGSGEKETEKEILPTEYTLYQNYPNPFNPTTTIKYDLPSASEVSLIIYDILGRKVKELVNTKQQAGRYEIQFNASNIASGVYIYQLVAEKFISSKKMILLK